MIIIVWYDGTVHIMREWGYEVSRDLMREYCMSE